MSLNTFIIRRDVCFFVGQSWRQDPSIIGYVPVREEQTEGQGGERFTVDSVFDTML